MTQPLNWATVLAVATDQMVGAVRRVRGEHPHETVYGAMFHEFSGDGTALYWPMVTVGTEEALQRVRAEYLERYPDDDEIASDLRWSGPDLPHGFEPDAGADACAQQVAEAARRAGASGGFAAWKDLYERFLLVFPKAAIAARRQLLREGAVGADFISIAEDEAGDLVPLSLTAAQVRRHFPQYGAAEQERRRLAALPIADRIDAVLPFAMRVSAPGPLLDEYDHILREIGEPVVPVLVDVLRGERRGTPLQAAMLLAEINHETPEAVAALREVMLRKRAGVNTQAWAAAALARLDHTEIIVEHASTLPDDVVVRGICAPYRSFRDRGRHRPLDYGPLAAALASCPELVDAVTAELAPGRGLCTLTADEIDEARAGLESSWKVIRTHAKAVLADARG